MKKTIFSIFLLIAVTFTFAQVNNQVGVVAGKQTNEQKATAKTEDLAKAISLTSTQKAKVYTIYLDFLKAREQYQPLKESNKQEFIAKMQPLKDKAEAAVNALLTAEQQAKFKEFNKVQK